VCLFAYTEKNGKSFKKYLNILKNILKDRFFVRMPRAAAGRFCEENAVFTGVARPKRLGSALRH
jgi:hypothetical protein